MIAERSGKDWTAQFNPFAAKRVQALTALGSRRLHFQEKLSQLRHGTGKSLQF